MNNAYLLLVSVISGAVEGLTEFLPISSTGHMIIVDHLLGFENETAKAFEIVIQLGSILAVIVVFRHQLFSLVSIYFDHQLQRKRRLTLIHVLLGILPTATLGLIYHDTIKSLFNPINVIYALVIGSLLLIMAEYLKLKNPYTSGLDDITYCQAFVIGCFQCLALWPGYSRSGATISGGVLVGLSRCAASEFSLLLAVPTIISAAILELYKSSKFLTTSDIPVFLVGLITAFTIALIVAKSFLQIINRIPFILFAIYRFILAILIYFVFYVINNPQFPYSESYSLPICYCLNATSFKLLAYL